MFIQPEALSEQTGSDFRTILVTFPQVQLALIIPYGSPIAEATIHTRLFITIYIKICCEYSVIGYYGTIQLL